MAGRCAGCCVYAVSSQCQALGVPAVTAHVINDARRLKEVKFLTYAHSPCWQGAEPGFEPWSLIPKPPSEPPRFLVSSLENEEGWSHWGSGGGHFAPCLGLMMILTHARWLESSQ